MVGKDVPSRRVLVAEGGSHPALYCEAALLGAVTWIAGHPPAQLSKVLTFAMLTTYLACAIRWPEPFSDCIVNGFIPSAANIFDALTASHCASS